MSAPNATVDRLASPTAALTRFDPRAGLMREVGGVRRSERERAARYGFRVGTLALLAQDASGGEVVEALGVSPLPGAAPWLAGMLNLRGVPVPVIDLARALGLPATDSSVKPMVLVLDKGDDIVGLCIDGTPVALRALEPTGSALALPGGLQPHAGTQYAAEGEVWVEFDYRALLTALARGEHA